MKNYEIRKLQKQYHNWSEHVDSYNYRNTPKDLRKILTQEEFDVLLQVPFSRVPESKKILVNEVFEGWELLKDLLVSLDFLPEKYLTDIYDANKGKYSDVELSNISGDEEEQLEKLIFCLLPDVIWSKSK